MKNSKTIKILILVSSVFLLGSFVAFKSGSLDNYLNVNNNKEFLENEHAGNLPSMLTDTLAPKAIDTTRVNPAMLSTSKSLILIDQKLIFKIKETQRKDSLMKIILKKLEKKVDR